MTCADLSRDVRCSIDLSNRPAYCKLRLAESRALGSTWHLSLLNHAYVFLEAWPACSFFSETIVGAEAPGDGIATVLPKRTPKPTKGVLDWDAFGVAFAWSRSFSLRR